MNSWTKLGAVLLGCALALNIGGPLQHRAKAGYARETKDLFDHCHAYGDSNCKNWGPGHECYLCENPAIEMELISSKTSFTHQQQSCGRKIMGECTGVGNQCDTGGNGPSNESCYSINVDALVPQLIGPGGP